MQIFWRTAFTDRRWKGMLKGHPAAMDGHCLGKSYVTHPLPTPINQLFFEVYQNVSALLNFFLFLFFHFSQLYVSLSYIFHFFGLKLHLNVFSWEPRPGCKPNCPHPRGTGFYSSILGILHLHLHNGFCSFTVIRLTSKRQEECGQHLNMSAFGLWRAHVTLLHQQLRH